MFPAIAIPRAAGLELSGGKTEKLHSPTMRRAHESPPSCRALTLFALCPYHPPIRGKADDLRLTVVMGLRKGLKLIRGMRRSLSENDQHKIASAIAARAGAVGIGAKV